MGQIKKVFADWQENEPSCDPNVYLKKYVKHIEKKDKEEKTILCPNCTKSKLVKQINHELKCDICSQEFIQIDAKTVRYK